MTRGRLHPALARELKRLRRAWGALNGEWLARPRDYSHGSPAFKWYGAAPCGADSARPRALRYGGNTAVTSPMRRKKKCTRCKRRDALAVAA